MMRSLPAMVREDLETESPLARFRWTLSVEEQAGLDKVLRAMRRYEVKAAEADQVLTFETLLLMTVVEQNERVERLEILLQRLAQRVVELYLGEGKSAGRLTEAEGRERILEGLGEAKR